MEKLFLVLRILGVIAVSILGWVIITGLRTTQFGNDFFVLLVLFYGLLFVFPFTFLPFIGLKPKQFIRNSFLLFFAIFAFSIIWATTEEIAVAKKYSNPEQNQIVNRHWPFQNHVMFYTNNGWAGQD